MENFVDPSPKYLIFDPPSAYFFLGALAPPTFFSRAPLTYFSGPDYIFHIAPAKISNGIAPKRLFHLRSRLPMFFWDHPLCESLTSACKPPCIFFRDSYGKPPSPIFYFSSWTPPHIFLFFLFPFHLPGSQIA